METEEKTQMNANETQVEQATESKTTVNISTAKIIEWALYVLGIVLIIVAIIYFMKDLDLRASGDEFEFHEKSYVGGDAYNYIISASRSSAVIAKSIFFAILGCSSVIVGCLTALINKKQS